MDFFAKTPANLYLHFFKNLTANSSWTRWNFTHWLSSHTEQVLQDNDLLQELPLQAEQVRWGSLDSLDLKKWHHLSSRTNMKGVLPFCLLTTNPENHWVIQFYKKALAVEQKSTVTKTQSIKEWMITGNIWTRENIIKTESSQNKRWLSLMDPKIEMRW